MKCLAVRKGRIGGLQTFGTAFSLAGAFHTHVRLFCGLDMHSKHTGWLTDCAQTVGNVFFVEQCRKYKHFGVKFSCLKVFSIRTLFSTMAVKKILVSCPFSWNTCLGLVSFYSFYFYGVGFQCLDSFSTMPSVPRYCLLGTQPVKNSLQQSPKCLLERSHELAYIDSLFLSLL